MTKEYKFQLGQLVKVTNSGYCFPNYKQLYIEMNFANKISNPSVSSGTVGQIFARGLHDTDNRVLLYGVVTMDQKEFLISEEGLKDYEFERPKISKEVIISSQYTALNTKDYVVVGCQTINESKLVEIIEAAKEVGLLKQ